MRFEDGGKFESLFLNEYRLNIFSQEIVASDRLGPGVGLDIVLPARLAEGARYSLFR